MNPASSSPPPIDEALVRRVDRLGYLLDNSIRIPIVGYRIGWDALIGLIPGIGDATGLVLSAYIVFEAARLGTPWKTLARMVGNVALEALIGAVPLLGDVFDATWKANARNVDLIYQSLGSGRPRRTVSEKRILIAVAVALVLLLGLTLFVFVLVIQALFNRVGS